jgi:hypothetical protein
VPAEAEASLSFAGLAGIPPDAVLDEVAASVPEAERMALETAHGRHDDPSTVAESGVVSPSLLPAAARAARRRRNLGCSVGS